MGNKAGWRWIGTDLSEAASTDEMNMATRLLADPAMITSTIPRPKSQMVFSGFQISKDEAPEVLTFEDLGNDFDRTPALTSDKLRSVLGHVWRHVEPTGARGIIFVYDEAQTLSDQGTR